MSYVSYIFTREGVIVRDGAVTAEQAAVWASSGQAFSFVVDQADTVAPVISKAKDIDQIRSISVDVANSNLSNAIKSAFAMTLGSLAGAISLPIAGPAGSFLVGEATSAAFELAYDRASNWSRNSNWGSLFAELNTETDFWSAHPVAVEGYLTSGSATMRVNQYSGNGREFVSVQLVDAQGLSRGEFIRDGADVIELPRLILDSVTWPAGVTMTHSRDVALTPADFNNAVAFASNSLQQGFAGNSVDYANDIVTAAGLSPYGVGNTAVPYTTGTGAPLTLDPALRAPGLAGLLDISSAAGQYAFNTAYLLGNSWASLWNDDYGVWALNDVQACLSPLGASRRQPELSAFETAWAEAGGSPIAIDLNGDGVRTISLDASTVRFDVTGDGIAERSAWLSPEDAFLAWDRDGNGRIEGVGELFGGMRRGEGFAELAALDSDGDGHVTPRDKEFSALTLWRDADTDGITDDGELTSLAASQVSDLRVDFTVQATRDHGNLLGELSSATVGGQTHDLVDVYFRYTAPGDAPGLYAGRPLTPSESTVEKSAQLLVQAMAAFSPPGPADTAFAARRDDLWQGATLTLPAA